MRKGIGGFFVVACALAAGAAPAGAAAPACTAPTSAPARLDFSVDGQPTFAFVARPPAAPRALVTYDHGYGDQPGDADDRRNLQLLSDRLHAIVVAPVYRGTIVLGPESTRGAPVRAGAADTVQLARAFRDACGRLPTIALGLSMGGTVAGLSAITGGHGLYDLWVGLNPMQDSSTASLASRITGATQFADDLDAEAGGTPLTAPAAYASFSLAQRHAELAHSGIRGAVIVDAAGDQTGAQLQTQLLWPLLLADGLTVDREIAIRKDTDAPPEGGLDTALLGAGAILTGHLGLTSVRIAAERIADFLDSASMLRLRIGVHDPALHAAFSAPPARATHARHRHAHARQPKTRRT